MHSVFHSIPQITHIDQCGNLVIMVYSMSINFDNRTSLSTSLMILWQLWMLMWPPISSPDALWDYSGTRPGCSAHITSGTLFRYIETGKFNDLHVWTCIVSANPQTLVYMYVHVHVPFTICVSFIVSIPVQ